LVAAKRLSRNGIGFELDESYAQEIKMRLANEGIIEEQLCLKGL
jgi:DNA modification methylase